MWGFYKQGYHCQRKLIISFLHLETDEEDKEIQEYSSSFKKMFYWFHTFNIVYDPDDGIINLFEFFLGFYQTLNALFH